MTASEARRDAVVITLLGLIAAPTGDHLANDYVHRLSDHRGYFQVTVRDAVRTPVRARPRHTLMIVVDGLREDAAYTMETTSRLRRAGTCARSFVGVPSLSRPVYAVLSTGLEQDRTGARVNNDAAPLGAESVWEVAREAGLRTDARSELSWWRQLFPRGFDRYDLVDAADDTLARGLSADLTLAHPVYADDAAHAHGTTSGAYATAVHRVDREIIARLDTMDLSRDLVVFTADHGHRERGGHGGSAPEVTHVLLCFAGQGVKRSPTIVASVHTAVAPTLSVLLGLRLPRNLRAVEDGLDLVERVVDPRVVGEDYFNQRRAAIAAAREVNARQLRAWSGAPTWSAHYASERRAQWLRALATGAASALLVGALVRKRIPVGARLASLLWTLPVIATFVVVYRLRSGGLDLTSLNGTPAFIKNAILATLCGLALGGALNVLTRGSVDLLARRMALVLSLSIAFNAVHVAACGWIVGFPLPSPEVLFAPFLMTAFQTVAGCVTATIGAMAFVRARRPTT